TVLARFYHMRVSFAGGFAVAGRWLPHPLPIGLNAPMPDLTRRRYRERSDCWHVYYGDVHVGTIARSVGNPGAAEAWQWLCGFYPGSNPGEQRGGTAGTVEQAARHVHAV